MNEFDNHLRVIIHIDIDCYYAQVEMNKNPQLQTVPMGVKQKNFIVTSNYIAREYGIKKCMYVDEALKLCPQLVTVNGEDLHDYRQISYQLTELLHKYSNLVERLGLDENFIDVTHLVKERLKEYNGRRQLPEPVGCVFRDINDDDDEDEKCECGCYENLIIGTIIAREIRDDIEQQLKLTVCAGIAHNKVLAKIVGKLNKPNQQTVVFPHSSLSLISSLRDLINIPGIGRVTAEQLETLKITTVEDLRNVDFKRLEIVLGGDKAKSIYNLCYGIDNSPVKISGRPQSIGIEDSYSIKSISAQNEIEDKLRQLLDRLLVLVNEDGRIPKTIKLTVRKLDKNNKTSHRETRQCNINPSLFNQQQQQQQKINTTTTRETKLMSTILHLFNRIVDCKKPYHITLLGLAFTKFHEPPKTSIVQFLRKNLEVQSITSIESTNQILSSPPSSVSSIEMQSPTPSTSSLENSPSPSPKKLKLTNLITKSMGFHNNNNNSTDECSSPSKLRVADLCLTTTTTTINDDILCPPTADKDVFKELPSEIQRELWENYKRERDSCCSSQVKKSKPNTLLNYFVKN